MRGKPCPQKTCTVWQSIFDQSLLVRIAGAQTRQNPFSSPPIASASPALRSAAIPLAARVALVKAIMLPTVLYGAEFWATSQQRVRMIWDLQKRAMRVLLLHSEHSTMIGLQAAYRELGMAAVCADCGARAVRLWVKGFALRSWIGKLVRDQRWRRYPTGQSTWTNRTFMWVSRLRGFGRRPSKWMWGAWLRGRSSPTRST